MSCHSFGWRNHRNNRQFRPHPNQKEKFHSRKHARYINETTKEDFHGTNPGKYAESVSISS